MKVTIIFQMKEEDVKPIHDDILIAKMNPGQVNNEKSGFI